MRVKATRDFAGRDGIIIREGEHVDFEDDADAYNLIHAGIAEPPLRLRSAIEGLIGRRNVEVGDLVDMPGDGPWFNGHDVRVEPLAAVVAAGDDGPAAAPPIEALRIIADGGRYATREEAEGLDLGGRDRLPKPEPAEPTGPTERLFFLNGFRLADGRLVEPGGCANVAPETADELVGKGHAEPLVKVRAVRDGVIAVNVVCSAGDVVDVPRSIAGDRSRFERIGLAEKAAGKAVDVLGAIDGRAAELVGKAEEPGPAEKAAKPAGKRAVAAPGPGDAR